MPERERSKLSTPEKVLWIHKYPGKLELPGKLEMQNKLHSTPTCWASINRSSSACTEFIANIRLYLSSKLFETVMSATFRKISAEQAKIREGTTHATRCMKMRRTQYPRLQVTIKIIDGTNTHCCRRHSLKKNESWRVGEYERKRERRVRVRISGY